MAKVSVVKIRGFIASVFAIVLILVLAVVATAVFDWNIPILSDIGQSLGL